VSEKFEVLVSWDDSFEFSIDGECFLRSVYSILMVWTNLRFLNLLEDAYSSLLGSLIVSELGLLYPQERTND
jgi:hypothetical protein